MILELNIVLFAVMWQSLNSKNERSVGDLLQRGTTKHLQTHKHYPRNDARAFSVPIGVFAYKIGRFRCKPIA